MWPNQAGLHTVLGLTVEYAKQHHVLRMVSQGPISVGSAMYTVNITKGGTILPKLH